MLKLYKLKKILGILFIILILLVYNSILISFNYNINQNYLIIQKNLNISFLKTLKNKINIGIYSYCLKNGGRARITSILLNYLNKIKIFSLYLFTSVDKEENEYVIPTDVRRTVIKDNILKMVNKHRIDILIYQLSNANEINKLNELNNLKVIYFIHSSAFYWIYFNYTLFKSIYRAYINSKYVVSLIPFENDFVFKHWGIRSILFSNFITYEYNKIIPSNLSSKSIIMIGRGNNRLKRFEIGILAMEYILKEIPNCELIIISEIKGAENLLYLANSLKIENNINFVGYTSSPEIYFKNISLHLFPSITEAFPLVLCETKIYGIPNILIGLDYISIAKGGVIINFDDSPENFAKKIIEILKYNIFRKKLGINGRNSMKKYNNELLLTKWIKLILSVYNDDEDYLILRNKEIKMSVNETKNILKNQVELLKKRHNNFNSIKILDYLNFTTIENLKEL